MIKQETTRKMQPAFHDLRLVNHHKLVSRPFNLMKLVFALLLILISPSAILANTYTAASCSPADVQAAVNAAMTGDTINVPAGTCDWGANTLSVTTAVKIIGVGAGTSATCDGNTKTCISGTGILINVDTPTTPSTFSFRLSQVYLSTSNPYMVQITGAGSGWRLDHNYFHHSYGDGGSPRTQIVPVSGGPYWTLYGLIDANIFKNAYVYAAGGSSAANQSWTSAYTYGSTDSALYIENNLFDGDDFAYLMAIGDSQMGGRAVYRYNTFYNGYIMQHGTIDIRGGRVYEIYNNSFRNILAASVNQPVYVDFRGGTGVVTDNEVAGRWTDGSANNGMVAIEDYRAYWSAFTCANSQCTASGKGHNTEKNVTIECSCCTGPGTGTCTNGQEGYGICNGLNPFDSVGQDGYGYMCMDQVGAGLQTGVIGSTAVWASDPIYVWNNTTAKVCLGGTNKYGLCTLDSQCPGSTCSTETNTPNAMLRSNDIGNQPYNVVAGRDYILGGTGRPSYTKAICPHPLAGSGTCDPNTAGTAGYIVNTFNDDPQNNFTPYINAISTKGITTGCGNGNYCPTDPVTRSEMAVLIIRALYGDSFDYTPTPYFTDVPPTYGAFSYIQKMKDAGITQVTGTYNVDGIVTRGQIAAFIIRALYGEIFDYTQTPYFMDVPSTHGYFKYVQKMKDAAITRVTGIYNVDGTVTRDQMAVFLARAFLGMQ